MSADDKYLSIFTTRVRQMMLHYQDLKQENLSLKKQISERDADIRKLEAQVRQRDYDYNSLMMAKMIEIGDGDMSQAKARLSKLIRDVNKCITLLSGK